MAIIDTFWKDVDDTLEIGMLDSSMLMVTMRSSLNKSRFDTSYLCKSDVLYLIDYLNSVVNEMCFMSDDIKEI